MVAAQLQSHLNSDNLHEPFQPGFHPKHSSETALVKITNDLLCAAESGLLTLLVLLDRTAAFDTISHPLLLECLADTGITRVILAWFSSYLTNRQQFVQLRNHKSRYSAVPLGVPQGAVLGSLFFIIYLLPLSTILHHHGVHFHCYADDTQVCMFTKPTTALPPSSLTTCLQDMRSWVSRNFLKLNSSKTVALITGHPLQSSKRHSHKHLHWWPSPLKSRALVSLWITPFPLHLT